MANKVLQIDSEKQKSANSYTYLDISMIAKRSADAQINEILTEPQLSDYYMHLMQEQHIGEDGNVLEEKLLNNLTLISSEKYNQYKKDYAYYLKQKNAPKYSLDTLKDILAIKNSIHNIFTWTPGERILNPEFGSNLRKLLYEGITDFNQEKIISEIRNAMTTWEPRVKIDDIIKLTSVDDIEENTVHIRILYSIPSLSNEQFQYDYSINASE